MSTLRDTWKICTHNRIICLTKKSIFFNFLNLNKINYQELRVKQMSIINEARNRARQNFFDASRRERGEQIGER